MCQGAATTLNLVDIQQFELLKRCQELRGKKHAGYAVMFTLRQLLESDLIADESICGRYHQVVVTGLGFRSYGRLSLRFIREQSTRDSRPLDSRPLPPG